MIDLRLGDCLDVLRTMPDESVDAIVTDPPYGLAFMGKRWDYDVPSVEIWQECLRVLKPGGHLLAFAGTRTQHRMCVRIEDAGFEIRDMIAWVYGSGFPKSHDVSKAIDKAAGVRFTESPANGVGFMTPDGKNGYKVTKNRLTRVGESTLTARQWKGWGTALKPALEPITVARKPLVGTVADNVTTWGTGAINVDGCRVVTDDKLGGGHSSSGQQMGGGWERPWMKDPEAVKANADRSRQAVAKAEELGRWPANIIHDGSDEVTGLFPGDEGRFFYCAKASKRDRDEGLDLPEATPGEKTNRTDGSAGINPYAGSRAPTRNVHPTVKPTDLMRYLCRLVTPPGGVVLDPFMGSGSTGKAAVLEGFSFVGVEREERYMDIARARIAHVSPVGDEKAEPVKKSAGQLALFP